MTVPAIQKGRGPGSSIPHHETAVSFLKKENVHLDVERR